MQNKKAFINAGYGRKKQDKNGDPFLVGEIKFNLWAFKYQSHGNAVNQPEYRFALSEVTRDRVQSNDSQDVKVAVKVPVRQIAQNIEQEDATFEFGDIP